MSSSLPAIYICTVICKKRQSTAELQQPLKQNIQYRLDGGFEVEIKNLNPNVYACGKNKSAFY